MAIPTRSAQPGTFFITTATFNRRRIFQVDANAASLVETLQHYRREGRFKLFGFVVMPDHVHLILTPREITLERAMQLIKGGFSRRIGSKFPVWQRGFTDHRIRDRDDFDTRLAYLHDNPVRARLVQRPEDYEFSSAYRRHVQADLSG
jgi:putative transposase